MFKIISLATATVLALSLSSCVVSKSKFDAMQANRDSLQLAHDNYRKITDDRILNLNVEVENLKSTIGRLQSELMTAKKNYDQLKSNTNTESQEYLSRIESLQTKLLDSEQKLEDINRKLRAREEMMQNLRAKLEKALLGFTESGLSVTIKDGLVYVSLSNQLLFSTGSTEIDKKGKEALLDLGRALSEQSDINILVEGHTDNQAVRGGQRFSDNWDLSVLRATEVVRYLTKDAGVDPVRVVASGRGEFFPITPGDGREERANNRRTEIILKPKLDILFDIMAE